jgi:molecular chaperone DnaK
VSAKDQNSGKEQKISITATTNLSEKDIERMVREAEERKKEDEEFKQYSEEINKADSILYGAEKLLADHQDKPYAEQIKAEKAKLEAIASETREAIKNKVALETITQKSVDLQNAMMEFNKAIAPFAQSDAGSNTSDSSSDHSNSSSGDDVIDAEFKASQVD